MRIFALAIASLTLIMASAAQATPTQVNVRIEGKSETLFEGPIWSEGHSIEASSDIRERPCDATNNHAYATPGSTPTVSAVEAMRIVGETFDGQWYPGYDDYFVTRWGADEQNPVEGAYWGILVNDAFANVGGCQYELHEDDEVLWVYDAFKERANLALFPAGDAASRPPLTAMAQLGQPFEVQVEAYGDSAEGDPPGEPDRADATPYSGARVAPVLTSPKGFERMKTASPEVVTTSSEGKASITFATPGWHRIKAATPLNDEGEEEAIRSNRIDVCVPAHGETGCGAPPAEDDPRTPPAWAGASGGEHHETHAETPGGGNKSGGQSGGGSQSGSGQGKARDPKFQPNLEATVRYLQNAQSENGGFAEPGTEPESDFTAWIALALAAAGINPRDQTTTPQHWVGGHSAYTYLAENAHHASLTTDFERELLVVDAAGTSPHDFGGVDLAKEILKRQIVTGGNAGAFPHVAGSHTPGVNDTIFAILSLSPIREPEVEKAVARATQWLEAQQRCDGSWNWRYTPRIGSCDPKERRLLAGEEGGEIDMTGAALQALNAVKRPGPEAQKKAFEYLREGERPNGGLVELLSEPGPNVASTAWVVQAMWSAGINPEEWLTHSGEQTEEPLSYMALLQQPDGHIRYEASEDVNGMWMTSYVTPAFTGNPLPIPAVPYEELPALPPEKPTGAGDGGVSTNQGNGAISGGGGDGAPLFSRPQPASKGHTPGGARQLEDQHHDTTKHRRNPGAARKTPAPAATGANVHRTKEHNHAGNQGTGEVALTDTGDGGQSSGREIKGLPIGAPAGALEPGAPGLRGAGAGADQTPWPAIGIAGALLVSALIGAQIELRRDQVTL